MSDAKQKALDDDIQKQKQKPWQPGIAVRILRTKTGDKIQQRYWRRTPNGAFEHEWRDLPIEVDEDADDSSIPEPHYRFYDDGALVDSGSSSDSGCSGGGE